MPDCQPLSSGSLCPESSGLTTFLGWLSLTGMVAHFAPDWWLSMVRIIQHIFHGMAAVYLLVVKVVAKAYRFAV